MCLVGNMMMGGRLNVIGLMCSIALFVDNAIWWRAAFLRCAEFVIQLIALLFESRCFLDCAAFWDHNDIGNLLKLIIKNRYIPLGLVGSRSFLGRAAFWITLLFGITMIFV